MMKLSIRTRLALLSLLPTILITGFMVQEFVNNRRQLESLDKTISRIHLQHGITLTAFGLYQGAKGDVLTLDELSNSDSFHQFMALLSQTPSFAELQVELTESLSEIKSQPDAAKRLSAEWGFEVLQKMLVQAQNQHIHLYSDQADTTEILISQLFSLSFWAHKEALLSEKIQQDGISAVDLGGFYQAISLQEQALARFLDTGFSPLHVETLREFLSSERYQSSVQDRDAIAAGQLSKQELSAYTVELGLRSQTLQQLIKPVVVEAEAVLTKEIEQQQRHFVMMTGTLFSLLSVLVLLATSTRFRVRSELNAILQTLRGLGKQSSHNEAPYLANNDNDEFTRFAKQVNQLMDEKQQQMQEIIHAKESAVAANRAKSTFLANMSHEIRTPLNGIIGMTEILAQSELTNAQKEILENIDTSSQTLLILLNDILDLSKIESGNLNLCLQEADVRETVYQSMTLFQSKATSKNIELHIALSDAIPAKVMADEHRIKQVLTNLIGNAIKFTQQGYISVFANYQSDEAETKGHLTFKVTDTGVGIEQEKLETIFEPFTQEDDSITRQFGGTGLGLAICRQLVSMMGGDLTALSTKGLGSCFSFTIPVERLPGAVWRSEVISKGLLIADNYRYINQLIDECRLVGITLTTVSNVAQATAMQQAFDVVFYCHNSHQNTAHDLDVLATTFSLQRVIVCQQHLFASSIDTERVHATLTMPFLGLRFKACIQALETKRSEIGSVTASYASSAPDSVVQGYGRNHRRILIAEDNLMNQKIASFFLEKAGFDYLITSNGQEALDAITQGGQFDAVLMDCMMPVMDGITATREIRRWENEQGSGKTPIIALTASVLEEDIQSCFDAGMDAYLPKPYKSNQLYALFNELHIA